MGWNLLSTRKELTKLNSEALYHHFHHGYPHCHEDDRPHQKCGNHVCKEEEWESYASGPLETPLSATKWSVTEGNCGRRSRALEMKAPADTKPDASPLLAAQAAHPPLPAPLIATGRPHRLHHEGGVREGDRAATCPGNHVKVVALAIVFLC